MKHQKEALKGIAVFIIFLVVTLPIYSASALAASIKIVKNQGEGGIEGFIKGDDFWTLEVLAKDGEIKVDDVKYFIGGYKFSFDSCSFNEMQGGYLCTKKTQIIGEPSGSYKFDVFLYDQIFQMQISKDSGVINVDASPPGIKINSLKQEGQELKIDFEVNENKGVYDSGLKKIEIFDNENVPLKTIEEFSQEEEKVYDKPVSVPLPYADSGKKIVFVKAYDKIGNEAKEKKELIYDKESPEVYGLVLSNQGFIPGKNMKINIEVNISDNEEIKKENVFLSSQTWNYQDLNPDSCKLIESKVNKKIVKCLWKDLEVSSQESVDLSITAKDSYGNTGTLTESKTFQIDEKGPEVLSFTSQAYEGIDYVNNGENLIKAELKDDLSGVDKDSVRIHSVDLEGEELREPDDCSEAEGVLTCVWEKVKVKYPKNNLILRAKDKVGNEIEYSKEFIMDNVNPKIKFIKAQAITDIDRYDFFKSGDDLELTLEVEEETGLKITIETENLLAEAEKKEFTHEACQDHWNCTLVLEKIKSFTSKTKVPFKIEVKDTAGNKAVFENIEYENIEECDKEGTCYISVLGTKLDGPADFWKVTAKEPEIFIDLDTVNLAKTRSFNTLTLESDEKNIEALLTEVDKCREIKEGNQTGYGLPLERSLIHSNFENDKPVLVLEFGQFDPSVFNASFEAAKEKGGEAAVKVPFECFLRIRSKTTKGVAYSQPQETKVNLSVKFGYSKLGAPEQNLEEKIKEAKTNWFMKIFGIFGVIERIHKYSDIFCKSITIADSVIKVINSLGALLGAWKITKPIGQSLCLAGNAGRTGWWERIYNALKIPCDLFSCRKENTFKWLNDITNPVNSWRKDVEKFYNKLGYSLLQENRSFDAYDSLILSLLTVCPAGIIYNLEKMRQFQCRYVYCLENEVKSGTATLDSCSKLRSYQWCKYVFGELFYSVPFINALVDALNFIIAFLKSFALGMGITIAKALCAKKCGEPSLGWFCDLIVTADEILSILDNIAYLMEYEKTLKGDYCSAVGLGWGW